MGSSNSKEIDKLKEQVKEKDARIQELMDKYSENMHTDLLADESTLENVNNPNRPMKIAEEYSGFCTDAWLDAKQEIDDKIAEKDLPEKEKIKLLLQIIIVAGEEAKGNHDDLWKNLCKILNEPIEGVSNLESQAKAARTTTQKMQNTIGDHYRSTADKISHKPLVKKVVERIKSDAKGKASKNALELKQVQDYIEEASRISWKMALQRPPMTFDTPAVGQLWKENSDTYKLEANYGSDTAHKDAIIHCYVHPIMYHNKTIMGRTKVLVGPPEMKFTSD